MCVCLSREMISEYMSLEEEGVDMSEDIRQREKLSTIAAIIEVSSSHLVMDELRVHMDAGGEYYEQAEVPYECGGRVSHILRV